MGRGAKEDSGVCSRWRGRCYRWTRKRARRNFFVFLSSARLPDSPPLPSVFRLLNTISLDLIPAAIVQKDKFIAGPRWKTNKREQRCQFASHACFLDCERKPGTRREATQTQEEPSGSPQTGPSHPRGPVERLAVERPLHHRVAPGPNLIGKQRLS